MKPVIPSWQLRPTLSSKASENERDDDAEDVPDVTEEDTISKTINGNLHGGKSTHVNGSTADDDDVQINGTSVNSEDD